MRSPVRRDAAIALGALVLVLAWDLVGLDLAAARLFGSPDGFAWRDHWLTRTVLHDGTRLVAWALVGALALLALAATPPAPATLRRAMPFAALTARERAWWLAVSLVAALPAPAIKHLSLTSCPWDLAEFGGHARYVSHWLWGVADGGGGHCFPSGHATNAFVLFSGGFALRRACPRLAARWQWGVLGAGLLLGLVQLARGAHYPSHTLWSAWLCWCTCALLAPLLHRPADDRAHAPAQGTATP